MSWLKKLLPIAEERPQGPAFGFQVLKNSSDELAIEPWFDFICGINGRPIEDGNSWLFAQEIRNCAGRDLSLTIWSAKGQRLRDLLVPVPADASAFGMTLQWCALSVTEDVWHILDVHPGSPADMAGLLPYSDYIIGTPEGIVRGESGLGELVEDHMDRSLRLYVYNHEYDVTRELSITPTRSWGGEGALGCILGFGALHRLPAPLTEPVQAPGETLFESRPSVDDTEPLFPPTEPASLASPVAPPHVAPYRFVPAADAALRGSSPASHIFGVHSPPPPAAPPRSTASPAAGAASRHKPRHAHHVDLSAMDDYMREGEQKSKEVEGGAAAASPPPGAVPPPPKRSQPPPPSSPSPQAPSAEATAGRAEHNDDDID